MKQYLLYIFLTLSLCFGYSADCSAIFNKTKTPDYYDINVREHFKKEEWSKGKTLLDEAWEEYGSMSIMNELMGMYYLHFKKYDKARFYLTRSLRDDNSNTHARELILKVEIDTGNYSSAICYINELLDRNPYARELWRKKIELYRKIGNNEEANRLLKRLRQIYPSDEVVKKDMAYLSEQRLAQQKATNNISGMVETLQELVKAYPNDPEYYMQLTNILLQNGRTADALSTSSHGARTTKNVDLMKKHAGILTEQGSYIEAINYLKDCERTYNVPSFTSLINDIEKQAAESSLLNDPYTSMQRLYARQHDSEALQFLLNTSIARCYYNDAMEYIQAAKKSKGNSQDLLYKEYIVNKGLGNKNAAAAILNKLHTQFPKNKEASEELAFIRYESASDLMRFGEYSDAIPSLIFVIDNVNDSDVKKSAAQRLFNCYLESKRYDAALKQLDNMKRQFDYENYISQKATILHLQGETEKALALLEKSALGEKDIEKAEKYAYQYEEYAIPYIRSMIEKGMLHQADKAIRRALVVCPTSNTFLHQGITVADLLNKTSDYNEFVKQGRKFYPEDPYFIVKEASQLTKEKRYEESIALLRPQLDVFVCDSALIGAYAESSQAYAQKLSRKKQYNEAIAVLDSALTYQRGNRELLYAKGLIYEKMHLYDSAYVYQKQYVPTLMDYREHSHHLQEILNRSFRNQFDVTYQYARPGDEDVISSNASLSYTRKNDHNDFMAYTTYAGRDGMAKEYLGNDIEEGGTGLQLGVAWTHRFINDSPWSISLEAAAANKYFPLITAKLGIGLDIGRDWNINLHGAFRRLHTYSRHYEWIDNPEYVPGYPDSEEQIYVPIYWEHRYRNLFQAGLTFEKSNDKFLFQLGGDVFLLMKKFYFNGQAKGQFYPVEGSRTHIFITGGAGNAPQTELLDRSIPAGFSKLNTYVGGGFFLSLNKYIGISLSGTWYTMIRTQNTYAGIWDPDESQIYSTKTMDYKNMYYIQLGVSVSF